MISVFSGYRKIYAKLVHKKEEIILNIKTE